MQRLRPRASLLFAALLALSPPAAPAQPSQPAQSAAPSQPARPSLGGNRRALVIYSYSRQLPWAARVVEGVDSVLDPLPLADRPYLFEENLDSSRVGDTGSTEAWADYLAAKYASAALDVVMTESQQAAAFLLERPELFPGAERYVFHYAASSTLGAGTGRERRYPSASDFETALRAVTALLPDTRRIVVVTDGSLVGKARREQIEALASSASGLPALEIWDDFVVDGLLEEARALGPGDAVFYLPVQRDRTGAALVPGVVAARLSEASPAPVFSHFDSLVGTGIVGGYMVSGVQLGRLMGRVAALGDGAAPASQDAYAEATMGYYFDARALERFGIGDDRLPPGSTVLFREPALLGRYWPFVAAAAALLVLESLLILALLSLSAQRRRAMALLADQRARLEDEVAERTKALADANAVLSEEVAVRSRAEEQARAMGLEKALLLKELQHRVKNSLGIITSLVSLEAQGAEDPGARRALSTLESRVAALASLYDILYATGGLEDIDLAEYLGRIVGSVAESLGADARGVAIVQSIARVRLDLKRAVSLGLIVNELMTDAMKYAFPEGRKGRIDVVASLEGDRIVVRVGDDGVGFPPGFDPQGSVGFGLNLVSLLAMQLRAELEFGNDGGAKWRLALPAETTS